MKTLFCIMLAIALSCTSALAKDVSLSWDASISDDVAGYVVLVKPNDSSLPFNELADVGNVLTYTAIGLVDADDHYFAVVAYDNRGNKSAYSNVVVSFDCEAPAAPNIRIDSDSCSRN